MNRTPGMNGTAGQPVNGSALQLPFPDASFDHVIAAEVNASRPTVTSVNTSREDSNSYPAPPSLTFIASHGAPPASPTIPLRLTYRTIAPIRAAANTNWISPLSNCSGHRFASSCCQSGRNIGRVCVGRVDGR